VDEPKWLPDFASHEERDKYFREHADYFTLVRKGPVGSGYKREEYKTLQEAEKAGATKALVGGTGWMIYAVIGNQSAFVKGIK
jgi:hypothetical protein